MPLCDVCQSTPWFHLPSLPTWIWQHLPVTKEILTCYRINAKKNPNNAPLGHAHHKSLQSLQEAAKSCEVCKLILREANRTMETITEWSQDEVYKDYVGRIGPPDCELWVCARQDGGEGFMVFSRAEKQDEVWLMAGGGYCVEYESSLANRFCGRVVPPDPMDPPALELFQSWVWKSIEDGRTDTSVLPSRVLDIGETADKVAKVKLHESTNQVGQYACLSYNWEASLPENGRFSDRELTDDITLRELPQAFQDAIAVTASLGIRYLWIDGLCIPPGEDIRYFKASERMANIYANSTVTIAATRSHSEADGFLGARGRRQYARIPYNEDGIGSDVLAFPIFHENAANGGAYVDMETEPLMKRAWAVQERYLSPRVLHLGSAQMSFESRTEFVTEDGYRHPESLNQLGEYDSSNEQEVSEIDLRLKWRGPRSWFTLVHHYSGLQISNPADKLPGFANLARFHGQHRTPDPLGPDQYRCGLWRSNMIEELLWQMPGARGKRCPTYRAPSWSWAAIDGEVHITTTGDYTDIAEIVDVQIKNVGGTFGTVEDARVVLNSPLLPIKIEAPETDIQKRRTAQGFSFSIPGYEFKQHYTNVDVAGETSGLDDVNLYFVPFIYKNGNPSCESGRCGSGSSIWGLVIQRATGMFSKGEDVECYQRLGAAGISNEPVLADILRQRELSGMSHLVLV